MSRFGLPFVASNYSVQGPSSHKASKDILRYTNDIPDEAKNGGPGWTRTIDHRGISSAL